MINTLYCLLKEVFIFVLNYVYQPNNIKIELYAKIQSNKHDCSAIYGEFSDVH